LAVTRLNNRIKCDIPTCAGQGVSHFAASRLRDGRVSVDD